MQQHRFLFPILHISILILLLSFTSPLFTNADSSTIDTPSSSDEYNRLGEQYLYGSNGFTQNFTLARSYFNLSASEGNPQAQHNFAVMYRLGLINTKLEEGTGMLYDYFSAMGESPLAKLSLGYRHLYGVNAPKSCDTAAQYYTAVAEEVVAQSIATPVQSVIEKSRLSDEKSRSVAAEEDEDVIQYYQHIAEQGDRQAQLALGHMHYYGVRGFEQNPERAARYFKAASAQGDTTAMASLGQMYIQGIGVEQNNKTAFELLKSASEQGNPAAQSSLGYLYLHGQGVERDFSKALKFFKLSADKGNAEAQFYLGTMYFAGLGTEKRYTTALQYFTLAGEQSHTRALFSLGQMHLNGLGTIQSCALGVKLHKAVAERGTWANVVSEAHRHFLRGNYEHAYLLYARAAEEGYEVAQTNAAWMAEMGYGVAGIESWEEEMKEKIKAEEAENDVTSTALSIRPPSSTGYTPRLRLALAHRHWRMSAQQGNIDALRVLGDYAFDGVVTGQPDYKEAIKQYSAAAEPRGIILIGQRNAQSMWNLGYMYEHGYGLSAPDYHLAKRYYDQCLEAEPTAIVPVKLALVKLYAKAWLGFGGAGSSDTTSAATTTTSSSSRPSSASSPISTLPGPLSWLRHQLALTGLSRWFDALTSAASLSDLFLTLEDILLALLCAALAIVVYYRSQR